MLMPLSASVLASVRETVSSGRNESWRVPSSLLHPTLPLQFASATSFAFYMSTARPNSRAIFYVSCVALVVYAVGLVDRGIAVGLYGQVQFGVYFTPVVSLQAQRVLLPQVSIATSVLRRSDRITQDGTSPTFLSLSSAAVSRFGYAPSSLAAILGLGGCSLFSGSSSPSLHSACNFYASLCMLKNLHRVTSSL